MTIDRMALLKFVSNDIPIDIQPFQKIAEYLDMSEDTVLSTLADLSEEGYIKRVGAVLKHQKATYVHNAMLVLNIHPQRIDLIGSLLASSAFVSHCYQRNAFAEWPYNLYAMLHAKSKEEISQFVANLVSEQMIDDFEVLWSVKEYKKKSLSIDTFKNQTL